ncbi:hypothetical protein M3I54_03145 [Paraburkholderia sp. CNPSo 3274]|nr:hypothetical protein [Paraburkholderia sp. CNPSo 3274]MCP3705992.1 hypothetical protein [Paraburkholderia sp. CNPSo 3274]
MPSPRGVGNRLGTSLLAIVLVLPTRTGRRVLHDDRAERSYEAQTSSA